VILATCFATVLTLLVRRHMNDRRLYVHQDILQVIDEYLVY